jgi:hypothetical protein
MILAGCLLSLHDVAAQNVPWITPAASLNPVPLIINCIPRADGRNLAEGDYIGIFNDEGRCYGLARWKDTTSFVITVYGSDGVTDGFNTGDKLSFKLWLRNEDCVLEKIAQLAADNPLLFSNTVTNRITALDFERLAVSYPQESYCMNEGNIMPILNYTPDDLAFVSISGIIMDGVTGEIFPLNSIPGTYTITFNTRICASHKDLTLVLNDFPRLKIMPDTFICGDEPLKISLSDQYDAVKWSTGETTRDVALTEPSNLWYRVTNSKGCSNADTFSVKKISIRRLELNVEKADCYRKGRITIGDQEIENGKAPYVYRLSSQLEDVDFNDLNEVPEGVYQIEVVNANGCVLPHHEKVIVEKDCLNDVPVFTPNEDGLDDRYFINAEGGIRIFDRNGNLKRRLTGPCYFDGNDENGHPLPMGTYLVVPDKGSNITLTIIR